MGGRLRLALLFANGNAPTSRAIDRAALNERSMEKHTTSPSVYFQHHFNSDRWDLICKHGSILQSNLEHGSTRQFMIRHVSIEISYSSGQQLGRVMNRVQLAWNQAALKAESNFVSGGSVLKLEVQILRRLGNKPYVAQLIQSGKRELYCYMVMTLLGESLRHISKRIGKIFSVSTQVRIGINTLFALKQIHDIGFIHRDVKPANLALGRSGTREHKFIHLLDFGLAREFIVSSEGKIKMRRPRQRALFRGTTRYCSINTHEKCEQGRVDDLWCLLYMLAELRGPLPWANASDKKEVHDIKQNTDIEIVLENCPVQLIKFAEHLSTLNYYSRPDYLHLYTLLTDIMKAGRFRYSDPYDWEMLKAESRTESKASKEKISALSVGTTDTLAGQSQRSTQSAPPSICQAIYQQINEQNPFPKEFFALNPLGI